MAELWLLNENGAVAQRWALGGGPVSVGRDEAADVAVPDDTLSRKHFLIWQEEEVFLFELFLLILIHQ